MFNKHSKNDGQNPDTGDRELVSLRPPRAQEIAAI